MNIPNQLPKTLIEFRDTYKSLPTLTEKLTYESDVMVNIWDNHLCPSNNRSGRDWKDRVCCQVDLRLHDIDLYERACIHMTATKFESVNFFDNETAWVEAVGYRHGPAGP